MKKHYQVQGWTITLDSRKKVLSVVQRLAYPYRIVINTNTPTDSQCRVDKPHLITVAFVSIYSEQIDVFLPLTLDMVSLDLYQMKDISGLLVKVPTSWKD